MATACVILDVILSHGWRQVVRSRREMPVRLLFSLEPGRSVHQLLNSYCHALPVLRKSVASCCEDPQREVLRCRSPGFVLGCSESAGSRSIGGSSILDIRVPRICRDASAPFGLIAGSVKLSKSDDPSWLIDDAL